MTAGINEQRGRVRITTLRSGWRMGASLVLRVHPGWASWGRKLRMAVGHVTFHVTLMIGQRKSCQSGLLGRYAMALAQASLKVPSRRSRRALRGSGVLVLDISATLLGVEESLVLVEYPLCCRGPRGLSPCSARPL